MQPEHDSHADLTAFLIGALDDRDSAAFANHLRTCASCRDEAAALGPAIDGLELMPERQDPPPDLRSKVLAAVADAASEDERIAAPERRAEAASPRATERRRWQLPRLAFAGLAGAAALIAAFLIGSNVGDDATTTPERGTVELAANLQTPEGGGDEGRLVVREFESGRRISFESDALPILPKGQFYELWFVGAGDSPSSPNRISAGTFHPNQKGISDVILHAAVDPSLFPTVEITSEPDATDPAVSGPIVAELDAGDLLKN